MLVVVGEIVSFTDLSTGFPENGVGRLGGTVKTLNYKIRNIFIRTLVNILFYLELEEGVTAQAK